MSKEAMKMALEALTGNWRTQEEMNAHHDKQMQAITALRETLAEQPAQQEPVAWMFQHEETGRMMCVDAQQVEWGLEKFNPRLKKIAPLYTSPPAQRTWVELTDDEITDIWYESKPYYNEDDFARAIEAKLKEKNT